MERRGFLGRLVAAAAAGPAVVLAKKAGAADLSGVVASKSPTDTVINLKTGEAIKLYTPNATDGPLVKMAEKMKAKKSVRTDRGLLKAGHEWYYENAVEQHSIGEALGMESREVMNPKYEWFVPADPPTYTEQGITSAVMQREFNYLQIVRTPATVAGREMFYGRDFEQERNYRLQVHLQTIRDVLEYGKRGDDHPSVSETSMTGGRTFFGSSETGRVVYMRSRGLMWRTWTEPSTDVLHGEWLSDIGWAP